MTPGTSTTKTTELGWFTVSELARRLMVLLPGWTLIEDNPDPAHSRRRASPKVS